MFRGVSLKGNTDHPHWALPAWLPAERLGLLLILLLSLGMRLYALGAIPEIINPDEAENTIDAIGILLGHAPPGALFGLDWKPQPAFSIYLLSLFYQVFGISPFVMRLPSALLSTLALIPFYILLRRHSSAIAALASTMLLSSQLAYLHFSRSGWENIHTCLYAGGALACFSFGARALSRSPQPPKSIWLWFMLSAVFCAAGLYGYFSGRLVPMMLAVYALVLMASYRPCWPKIMAGTVLTLSITALLFLPMVPTLIQQWDYFMQRSRTVSFIGSKPFQTNPQESSRQQLEKNISVLWDGKPNNQPRYFPVGEALLDLPVRLLVFGGMLGMLLGARQGQPERWLWWIWLGIGWSITQLLTTNTPDMARGIIFLPALIAFTSFSIDWLVKYVRTWPGPWPTLIGGLAALLLLWQTSATFQSYLAWQMTDEYRNISRPYVLQEEFPFWQAEVEQRFLTHAPRLSTDEWRTLNDTSISSQVTTPSLTTGPQAVSKQRTWPTANLSISSTLVMLRQPRSLAFGRDGSFYVLDAAAEVQAIFHFSADGRLLRQWGGPGTPESTGQFVEATALASNSADELLVLDAETGWIHIFDAEGNFLRRWGGPTLGMYKPRSFTLDQAGKLYIADTGRRRILVFTPEQQLIQVFGIDEAHNTAPFVEPSGVLVLKDGSVITVDAVTGKLYHFTKAGTVQSVATPFNDLAVDGPRLTLAPDGTFYLTSPQNCQVFHMATIEEVLAVYGDCTPGSAIRRPGAVALTRDGRMLVADLSSGTVVLFEAP